MRQNLIDLDKLEADIEYWENHDDPKKPDYDTRDIEQVIGFQPIVEAIPVEWIRECARMAELCGDEKYSYQLNVLLNCWKAEWNDSDIETEDHIQFTFPAKGERI